MTVPLPVPGRLPLSISLLALHKKDLSLLQAAAKLGPLLAEEAARLAAEQAQQGKQQPGGGGRGAAAAGGGRRRGSSRGGEAEEEARARAEACKAAGNEAYKARRYEEAARQYSAAVQLDPRNPTYYSNRCAGCGAGVCAGMWGGTWHACWSARLGAGAAGCIH